MPLFSFNLLKNYSTDFHKILNTSNWKYEIYVELSIKSISWKTKTQDYFEVQHI